MGFAHEYAAAILARGRVRMEPADFAPDWSDRPRKAKFYPEAEAFPLPDGGLPPDGTVQEGLYPTQAPAGRFTLPLLSGMLLDSYGQLGRRLAVHANTDLAELPFYPRANWFRGASSGGGLYPVSIYWVCGAGGAMTPGVYHYSTARHAMVRLSAGDVSGDVREALGGLPAAEGVGDFLVLGVKFWQNAFKYNSFCYHAVSMDVGALLQTWRIWAVARGLPITPALWFDEERLGRLLALSPEEEGLFAVVPLPWRAERAAAPAVGTLPTAVRHRDRERSRRVLAFETVRRIQAATLEGAAARPAPKALDGAAARPAEPAGQRCPLPPPTPLDTGVRDVLRRRRSSFGRFRAGRPMSAAELSTALAATAATGAHSDAEGHGEARLAKLYAFVNHVEGIAPGAYEYDPVGRELRLVKPGPPGAFLQKNYFLANYNLEQAGAVLVPTVRTAAVLDAVGDRGYRLVNATVGAIAQTHYTTAAALGLAGGVALGFDNLSFIEELGLPEGEAPLIIMLIGHERPGAADFRYEIA
ncbi:nitroreductase family protein [Streptomyces sp. NPDC007264]|uniref:nitroreductase family protein n=1 Tax=Streptomyces sp. NPDC007264 TaxID=3364777 RepID=UPI0036D8AB3B